MPKTKECIDSQNELEFVVLSTKGKRERWVNGVSWHKMCRYNLCHDISTLFAAELMQGDFPVNSSPANAQQASSLGLIPVSFIQSI